jgi:hypothetical protein
MRKSYLIIPFVLLIFAFFVATRFRDENAVVLSEATKNEEVKTEVNVEFDKQSITLGSVEIEAQPTNLSGDNFSFKVWVNTHSGDLSYDFTKIANLSDGEGNIYKVLSWNGGLGGHHLVGDLVFEPLNNKTKKIKLSLSGVDGNFGELTWELNNGKEN